MSSDPYEGPLCFAILFLVIHAWCISGETALRALSERSGGGDEEKQDRISRLSYALLENSQRSIMSLQIFRLLCCLLCGSFVCYAFKDRLASVLAGPGNTAGVPLRLLSVFLLECIAMFLLSIFGTYLPSRIASETPERTFRRTSIMLWLLAQIMRPVVFITEKISGLLLRTQGIDNVMMENEVTEDDILQMVDIGEESGTIEEDEKEMIANIFQFNNITAEDIMTHRKDVEFLWADDEQEEILRIIRETGYTRFPVYGDDMDDIIGTLNARDFLLNAAKDRPSPLREIIREAYYVPEHIQADVLFREMQRRKVHMSVVIDEYGGMSGIVTMEDLLEQIVGNIYDEFDEQAESEITKVDDNLWRISGSALLSDVSEALGITIPENEDFDTLGGLIFSQLTTIPKDGTHPEVETCGLHIRVEKLEDHRVESAMVSIIEPEGNQESDQVAI